MNELNHETKENDKENQDIEERETQAVPLPYCTSAPDAEQHRSSTDDIEPCDDARGTEFEWEKKKNSQTDNQKNQSSKDS